MSRPRMGACALVAAALCGAAAPALALDPARHLDEYGLDVWRTSEGLPQNSILALEGWNLRPRRARQAAGI